MDSPETSTSKTSSSGASSEDVPLPPLPAALLQLAPRSKKRTSFLIPNVAPRGVAARKATAMEEEVDDQYCCEVVPEKIVGSVLLERYRVGQFLSQTHNGYLLEVRDMQNPTLPLVIKILSNTIAFEREVSTLKTIGKGKGTGRLKQQATLAYGLLFFKRENETDEELKDLDQSTIMPLFKKLHEKGILNQFIILPRPGLSVADYFQGQGRQMSVISILDLGFQLVEQLEQLHRHGFVYNFICPENLCFSFHDRPPSYEDLMRRAPGNSCFDGSKLHLVDHSIATRYTRDNGFHLPLERDETMDPGSLVFSSLAQLRKQRTSRRDDLISVFYLLSYLLNGGRLMDWSISQFLTREQNIAQLRNSKLNHRIKDICCGEATFLKRLMVIIFSIDYADTPPYNEIKDLLLRLKLQEQRSNNFQQSAQETQTQLLRVSIRRLSSLTSSIEEEQASENGSEMGFELKVCPTKMGSRDLSNYVESLDFKPAISSKQNKYNQIPKPVIEVLPLEDFSAGTMEAAPKKEPVGCLPPIKLAWSGLVSRAKSFFGSDSRS